MHCFSSQTKPFSFNSALNTLTQELFRIQSPAGPGPGQSPLQQTVPAIACKDSLEQLGGRNGSP